MDMNKNGQWLTVVTNIGVIVGVLLLVYELNQNSMLMRAEMHAMRAEAKADRQIGLANSGEFLRISAKLTDAGFPANENAIASLTTEEQVRYAIGIEGLKEALGNWHYQCQQEMLDEELCQSGYELQLRFMLRTLYAGRTGIGNMRQSFIEDARRAAAEYGLPMPNEDGSWPE